MQPLPLRHPLPVEIVILQACQTKSLIMPRKTSPGGRQAPNSCVCNCCTLELMCNTLYSVYGRVSNTFLGNLSPRLRNSFLYQKSLWIKGVLLYWFRFLLHGTKQTNKLTIIYSQAFVAVATSSGEIQTLIDKDINQLDKINTIKSESKLVKVRF